MGSHATLSGNRRYQGIMALHNPLILPYFFVGVELGRYPVPINSHDLGLFLLFFKHNRLPMQKEVEPNNKH